MTQKGTERISRWRRTRFACGTTRTPRLLHASEARRAFEAMMGMKKIDLAAIEAARLTLHNLSVGF
jgi:predicted 3-demethylubiquinone-9 3-methyltransferase (glyoxalase superfamily)